MRQTNNSSATSDSSPKQSDISLNTSNTRNGNPADDACTGCSNLCLRETAHSVLLPAKSLEFDVTRSVDFALQPACQAMATRKSKRLHRPASG